MRAIWSGAIGFGLVNIPVKMYSAVQESSLDLDMLDKHDNANIKFQRVNAETGEEVAYGDIVKGYKLNNSYVVLDDEDFEAASPKKSQIVEIDEFVEAEKIDGMFYETPYYLAPDKGGEKAYALLRDALEDSGKVGIGTYVMRGKQHLCMLRPVEDAIVLLRLRFEEEIRSTAELPLPGKVAAKPAELKMAKALIEHLTPKTFSLKKYKDTYHQDLLKIIRAKAKGKEYREPQFKVVKTAAKDLMAELKASLEAPKGRKRA